MESFKYENTAQESMVAIGAAAESVDHAVEGQHAVHSMTGAQDGSDRRDGILTNDSLGFKLTQSQFDSQPIEPLLQGTPPMNFSQDLLPLGTGTQTQELQQLMQQATEKGCIEWNQGGAPETAAALRGAAQASADEASDAVAVDNKALTGPTQAAAASRMVRTGIMAGDFSTSSGEATAAVAVGVEGPCQLDLLAQTAMSVEQQAVQQCVQLEDPGQQLNMHQFADPAWAAAYAGIPAAAWGAQANLLPASYWGTSCLQSQYAQRHSSLAKPEHATSNAKRRGPMDEMRQLQRILTKLLPGSIIYMPNQDGGGNKVQADDIKVYLAATLGEAPKPDWGLKNGWAQYLADLFNWATNQDSQDDKITNLQAMACARRPQGRSWEVVFDNLMELGIYSWNWELPLRREQVINCLKTPPPELTRQQEALAAATAAAAAAAAVTAGATPDAIPSLPVVARMASLLGKRQHQQLAALPGPQALLLAPMAIETVGTDGAMLTASSPADPAKPSAAEGSMDEMALKRPCSSSRLADPGMDAATSTAGAAGARTGTVSGVEAAETSGTSSQDCNLPLLPVEALQAASVQQLLAFVDGTLSSVLQALQNHVLSGTARCPSLEYIMNVKNYKLDPLYASLIALTLQAASAQAAVEQRAVQQNAMQQPQQVRAVKQEADSRSNPDLAPAAAPAATEETRAAASVDARGTEGLDAGALGCASAAAAAQPDAGAGLVEPVSEAEGNKDKGGPLPAVGITEELEPTTPRSAAAAAVAAAKSPAGFAVAGRTLNQNHKAGKPARDTQQDSQQLAKQQQHVQQMAAEAAAMAARQQQQPITTFDVSPISAAAAMLARKPAGLADGDSQGNSEDAAQAAALALTTLAGSQDSTAEGLDIPQQLQPASLWSASEDASLQKRRIGSSRLATGTRSARASPMKAR